MAESGSERARPDMPPRATDDVRYLVTLVHGTFARETEWVKEGSALRKALDELGGVRFDVFQWTGHNNHAARLTAGKELAQHLDRMAIRYPAAKRVVIAHSHGGNVALYAGRQVAKPDNLAHLVCLATPFLVCEPMRNPMRLLLNVVGMSLALGTMAGALLFGVWRYGQSFVFGSPLDTLPGAFDTTLSSAIVLASMLGLAAVLFVLISGYAGRLAAEHARQLGWRPLPATNVLSTVYRFDEAERFLGLVNALAARPARVMWGLVELAGILFGIALATATIGHLLMLGAPSVGKAMPDWAKPMVEPTFAGYARFLIYYGATFVVLAPLAFVFPLLRGNPWAYGWERPSMALLLDVLPKDRPATLKARSLEHFEISIGSFGAGKAMAHTVIYDDERIQRKLVDWIGKEPAGSADGRILASEAPQHSSNSAWALPWRTGSNLAVLVLPVMLALGITLAHPTPHGLVWLDLEPLQYLLAAVLGAWGGLAGLGVVALAALMKCLRYAGELSVPPFDKLRVVNRGSLGEAGALIAVALMFAQRHRLRLTLRADTLTARHAIYLGTLALLTVLILGYGPLSVSGWPYVWLMLIAFLIGLSGIPLAGPSAGLTLMAGIAVFAALSGIAPLGKMQATWLLLGIPADLTLAAPMQALNLVLVALLGRGLRQRRWPGAARELPNRIGLLITSPRALVLWALLGLGAWCFALEIAFGQRAGTGMRPLLLVHPLFAHAIALVAFTAGALYGRRAVRAMTLAYLLIGLALPTALAVLAAPEGNPQHTIAVALLMNGQLQIATTLGHLHLGRGLELPLYALLGAAVAARAPELQRQPGVSAARVAAIDGEALRADDLEPEARQIVPSLSFRMMDVLVPVLLVVLIAWGCLAGRR